MPSDEVPPEIWALIAQYLPEKDVVRLISVNRVFFALAMDEKYKELVVKKVDRTLVRTLEVLRNPINAKRVRSLHLEPSTLRDLARAEAIVNSHHHEPLPPPAPSRLTTLSTLTSQLLQTVLPSQRSPAPAPPISATQITSSLTALLPLLRGVTTLTFVWDQAAPPSALPHVPLAFRSLGVHLLHLHIMVHPRALPLALPQETSFPRLRTLRLVLTVADNDPRDLTLTLTEPLARFVNKFQYTLESLYIGSPQRRDLHLLYASLSHFPKLSSFEISPHTFSCPSTFLSFLSAHADSLTSLTYVSDSNPLFVSGLSSLELNALEKLVMRLHYVPYPKAWWNVPSAFFSSVSGTLRVLVIEGAVTAVELEQVLHALVGSESANVGTGRFNRVALESLTLSIHTLTPYTLRTIAKALPGLKSLNLRIHDVAAGDGLFPITPSEFFPYTSSPPHPRQTSPTSFTSSARAVLRPVPWSLEDICIKRRACCGDLVQWGLMQFLAGECVGVARTTPDITPDTTPCMHTQGALCPSIVEVQSSGSDTHSAETNDDKATRWTPSIKSFCGRGTLALPDPPNAKPEGKVCTMEVACPFWVGAADPGGPGVGRDYSP